jgi:hypothetical protein
MTISAIAEVYLAHLAANGRSPSTCATTKRTLALLVAHLGADRKVGDVVAEDLEGFFASEAATKQRGKPRAAASVAQLRGIVRAAFAWWQQDVRTPTPTSEPREAGPPPSTPAATPTQAPTVAPGAAPPASTPAQAPQPLVPAAAPPPGRAIYLDLSYQGQPVRFAKIEIDRARLHGLRRLVALDAQGRECESALLTRDGRYVLQHGSTADLYINECGDAVPRRELVAVDEAGALLSASAPPPNGPREIVGPLAAPELLDYVVVRVDALLPVTVPAKLAQALGAGALFRVPHQPRPTVAQTPAFLLGGEAGAFLIQVEPHGFDYVGPDQPALPADDPDEDDLDVFAFPDNFGGPDVSA